MPSGRRVAPARNHSKGAQRERSKVHLAVCLSQKLLSLLYCCQRCLNILNAVICVRVCLWRI